MNPNEAQSVDRDEQLGQVLAEWLESAEQGRPPDEREYLGRYPEFRAELAQCIADWKRFPRPHGASERLPENGILGDFRIIREVGRGGMGVVYEAEQISLGRRVALKVLPFAATMDPRHLQRFQNEARAAASLEHPHIVPVYGVGCERGVHYYAMKFIDGQSLAEVIDEVRKAKDLHHRATENTEKRQQTVVSSLCSLCLCGSTDFYKSVAELGIQAAEALEHAHSLGIVHRDIKPANLMIENSPASSDHSPLTTHHLPKLWITDFGLARTAADAGLTMTGDVLGTLRYMSPEQALAKHGLVDHRTDVYSLGVTLYELLTGQEAVDGKDREEILNAITLQEPRSLRTRDAAIPRDLETIVLKAIAKEAVDRYGTARELGEDLRNFMESRPLRARRPGPVLRIRKWSQRHRTLVTAAIAFLILTGAIAIISTGLIWQAYRAQAQAHASEVEARKDEAAKRLEAEAQKLRARAVVNDFYTEVAQKWLANQSQLTELQRALLHKALDFYKELSQEEGIEPDVHWATAQAYGRAGEIEQALGQNDGAEQAYRQAIAILEKLHAEFPSEESYRFDLANVSYHLASLLSSTGHPKEAEPPARRSLEFRQQLAEEFPGKGRYRSNLAVSFQQLGILAHRQGRLEDAEQAFRRVLTLTEKLVTEFPADTLYQAQWVAILKDLCVLLCSRRKATEAEQLYRQALPLLEKTVAESASDQQHRGWLADSRLGWAKVVEQMGRREEAEKLYRQALDEYEGLAADFPRILSYRNSVVVVCNALGSLLMGFSRLEETESLFRKALAQSEKLAAEHLSVPDFQSGLGAALNNLAAILIERRQPREACELAERAIRSQMKALAINAQHPTYRLYLGNHWNTLAVARYRVGDWQATVAALNESMKWRKGGDSNDWFFLAMAQWRLGDKQKAREWFDKAVQWMDKNEPRDEDLHRYRAEAAALLKINEKPSSKPE
jgi:serine/threonine protein kinase